MADESTGKEPDRKNQRLLDRRGGPVALGICLGLAAGAAFGNPGAGMAIGIAIGVAVATKRRPDTASKAP